MAVPIVATAGCALAVIVTLGFAFPAAAAAACPTCFGFEREASGVYIEQSASPTDRTEISIILDEARQRVSGFYGSLRSNPRILICVIPSCYQRIDGGELKGMAIMTFALFLSPHGTTPVIASHELSHIELHARLGLWQTWRRAAPQWFDEGVAVAVSGDPRYLAPVSATVKTRSSASRASSTLTSPASMATRSCASSKITCSVGLVMRYLPFQGEQSSPSKRG